jgi:hypothetical protein
VVDMVLSGMSLEGIRVRRRQSSSAESGVGVVWCCVGRVEAGMLSRGKFARIQKKRAAAVAGTALATSGAGEPLKLGGLAPEERPGDHLPHERRRPQFPPSHFP